MFRFENVAAFQFLWAIPVLIILRMIYQRIFQKKIESAIGSRMYPFLTKSVSSKKRRLKDWFSYIAIVFFVIALARPQFGASEQQVKSQGVEIIIAVDVSESMMSEDVRPSRLDQVKAELGRLVDQMPGNKIGIVAFAGSAVLLSPLTNDPGAVKMYLESLQTNSVSTQGTNFQEALAESEAAFKRGGVEQDDLSKVTRVVLIASDGEDHEQGAIDQAQKMAKDGIRIFSLAYGTEKGGAIPVRDGMGFLKGYKKDRQGQTIITTVKGDALRALAEAGKGSFYYAAFGGDHIKSLAEDINKLEKEEFESSMAVQYDERFQVFLFIGIILAFFELFIGERRSGFRFWKGRFEVPPL